MNQNKSFEHYGIKGMRWGVRRENPRAAAAAKAQTMTTAELRSAIERKTLEARYVDVMAGPEGSSSAARGAKLVSGIVANSGKRVVQQYSDALVADLVKKASGK